MAEQLSWIFFSWNGMKGPSNKILSSEVIPLGFCGSSNKRPPHVHLRQILNLQKCPRFLLFLSTVIIHCLCFCITLTFVTPANTNIVSVCLLPALQLSQSCLKLKSPQAKSRYSYCNTLLQISPSRSKIDFLIMSLNIFTRKSHSAQIHRKLSVWVSAV